MDVLYLATSTPTSVSASLAARVGRRLGVSGGCVDVRAGGGGALHAWLAAVGLCRLGARVALVVAAETPSRWLAPGDASGALYGDGAGALVLGPGDGGLVGAVMGTVAVPGRPFTVPGPLPPTPDGLYAFQAPDRTYTDAIRDCWARTVREVAAIGPANSSVPYAVTEAQLAAVGAVAGLPASSVLDRHGCLGAAGIPVALHELGFGPLTSTAAVAGGAVCVGLVWRSANV